MEPQYKPRIVFRFRCPGNSPKWGPSTTMQEALQKLTESDEMRDFVTHAHSQHRNVVVELFRSSDGHPLLIHLAATPQRRRFLKLR